MLLDDLWYVHLVIHNGLEQVQQQMLSLVRFALLAIRSVMCDQSQCLILDLGFGRNSPSVLLHMFRFVSFD